MAGLELEMEILDDRGKTVIQHRDLTMRLYTVLSKVCVFDSCT